MQAFKLVEGEKYDRMSLYLIDWTDGDGSGAGGYDMEAYFDSWGRYLGPDKHGIEPIVGINYIER